jgi:hypothetical protein
MRGALVRSSVMIVRQTAYRLPSSTNIFRSLSSDHSLQKHTGIPKQASEELLRGPSKPISEAPLDSHYADLVPPHRTVVIKGLKSGVDSEQIANFLAHLSCPPSGPVRSPTEDRKAPGRNLAFLNYDSRAEATRALSILRSVSTESLPSFIDKESFDVNFKWQTKPKKATYDTPGEVIPDGLESFIRSQYRQEQNDEPDRLSLPAWAQQGAAVSPVSETGPRSTPSTQSVTQPASPASVVTGETTELCAAALVRVDAWEMSGGLTAKQVGIRTSSPDMIASLPSAFGACSCLFFVLCILIP